MEFRIVFWYLLYYCEQIWSYEHINIARPALRNSCLTFPRICQWDNSGSYDRHWFATKFKDLQDHQVVQKLTTNFNSTKVNFNSTDWGWLHVYSFVFLAYLKTIISIILWQVCHLLPIPIYHVFSYFNYSLEPALELFNLQSLACVWLDLSQPKKRRFVFFYSETWKLLKCCCVWTPVTISCGSFWCMKLSYFWFSFIPVGC